MASPAFTAITILLPSLKLHEIEALATFIREEKKNRIVDGAEESTNEENEYSSEEEENDYSFLLNKETYEEKRLDWEGKTLDELIKENYIYMEEEEELIGDSLSEPIMTKEELDKELEDYFAKKNLG